MSYVNIKTKQIVEVEDILTENPNTNFPSGAWTDEILDAFGYAELNYPETVTPGPYEYLEEVEPKKAKDGKWYRTFVVKTVNAVTKLEIDAAQWNKVRQYRNTALSESDWTQLSDSPVNKEEWATYRQALRDITDTTTDPFNVVWPNPPITQTT